MSNHYLKFDVCDTPLIAKQGSLEVGQLASSGIGVTPKIDRVKEAIAKGYVTIQY
jgi:hypothetical protein